MVLIGGIRRRNRELRSTSSSSTRAYIGQVYSNASSAALRVEGQRSMIIFLHEILIASVEFPNIYGERWRVGPRRAAPM